MSQHSNEEGEEEVKKKSKQLTLLIEKYNKELEKVRKKCRHNDIYLKFIFDENGASKGLRTVCKSCEKITGYPNKSQSDEYYGDMNDY